MTVGLGQEARKTHRISFDRVLAVFSLLFSACIVSWVLWFCRYGFDFTDEGFYLNWISNPFNYKYSVTQYGFVYHPLYLLLDGDLANLRQVSALISYALALGATWILLVNSMEDRCTRFAVAAALATTGLISLVFGGLWFPTPSYNTLAYQGLIIVATGFFLLGRRGTYSGVLGCILIGIGGGLTFLGKPPSAAVAAVLSIIYLSLVSGAARMLHLAISGAMALGMLMVTAWLIDGSIMTFVDRHVVAMQFAKILGGGHSLDKMLRLEKLEINDSTLMAILLMVGTTFFATCLAAFRIPKPFLIGPVVAVGIAIAGIFIAFQLTPLSSIAPLHRSLLVFSLPVGLVLAGIAIVLPTRTAWIVAWRQLFLFSLILLFPYAYAFGTGDNYWYLIGSGALFVVLAAISLLRSLPTLPHLASILLLFGLSIQVTVALLINSGISSPYRQPRPLYENTEWVQIGKKSSVLLLHESHARYLSAVTGAARHAGWLANTPMIDLTGRSPGVLYALQANSIGVAWAIGGYPGSRNFVVRGLETVPCEQLVTAWILSEAGGPRSVPVDVLASFNSDLTRDYQIVGELTSPEGYLQFLSKPTRNAHEAIQACNAARANAT